MSKRKLTVNVVLLCLLAGVCVFGFVMARNAKAHTKPSETVKISKNVEKQTVDDSVYYISHGECGKDQYDVQLITIFADKEYSDADINARKVLDYSQYQAFCKRLELERAYDDPVKNYIVVTEMGIVDVKLSDVVVRHDWTDVYLTWNEYDIFKDQMSVVIIPTDTPERPVKLTRAYNEYQYKDLLKYGVPYDPNNRPEPAKPIVYLDPEAETDVNVTLGYPESVTHAYPKYDGSWRVRALPDGTLTDLKTGRELYSLYYENVSAVPLPQTGEGFVVRGEDTAAFLEEKLALLGLTDREAEEFIVYWLPRLEDNAWNYIRFATPAELAAEMPLTIEPKPDTLIRVLMLWRVLDGPIEVAEQPLETPTRTGFTAVEWGGTEIS